MYYSLNNNVYVISGKKKGCIYDLRNSKLYSINKTLEEKIKMANLGQVTEKNIDNDLKTVFDYFLDNGILRLSATFETHQIEEIKEKDTGCKFAWIEITSKCNLKCIHCYNESDVHCDNVMSLENFMRVVNSLVKSNIKRIQIIGGEPFYDRKILKSMLKYAIGKFDFIEIFTNGTLISADWFEFLSENQIKIALSVYSYDAKMHDSVTGSSGSFERTNKTIQELRNHGIQYRVCNVLMKNIELGKKETELYELREDKDIVRMSGRANFALLSDDLIKRKLITKKTFREPMKMSFCKRLVSGHNCFKDKIYISANMDVYPCVMERRMQHCSLKEQDEILLEENIRNFTKDRVNDCSECEYRYACFDCRPNSLSENIYEKPWYCTYSPARGEWCEEEEFIKQLRATWEDK